MADTKISQLPTIAALDDDDVLVVIEDGATKKVTVSELRLALAPAWTTWAVSWTATGSNPAIGNGTLIGRYMSFGKTIVFEIRVTMGSTTTYGSGQWRFSPPVSIKANIGATGGVFAVDQGTAFRVGIAYIDGDNNVIRALTSDAASATEYTSGVPHTWADTDLLILSGTYEAD